MAEPVPFRFETDQVMGVATPGCEGLAGKQQPRLRETSAAVRLLNPMSTQVMQASSWIWSGRSAMVASLIERAGRHSLVRLKRQAILAQILGALEALQRAGVGVRVIMPLWDDKPVEFLADAPTMPVKALVARLLKRGMGTVTHDVMFVGDLQPDHLAALQAKSLDLDALRQQSRRTAPCPPAR
ncbi:hypothetical protein CRT60_01235 [Azospirillum palustre]|uniref:Uncharacterized protein n=2 Tax=Azospirillum palustre TaxID=2044885 RepID=A0A2B8BD56_9PROT|nr:hypothetical protein CRT60_01235 [Azospirillum palustre]